MRDPIISELVAQTGNYYVSVKTGIPIDRIERGEIKDEEWPEIARCLGEIQDMSNVAEKKRLLSESKLRRIK